MKIRLLTALALLPFLGFSQWSINTLNQTHHIDFDNTLSGVNFGQYAGGGFISAPSTAGRLNSDAWKFSGLGGSVSSINFGGTAVGSTDAALGDYDGITGGAAGSTPQPGIYSFTTNSVSPADRALGWFSDGVDLDPVTLTLKVVNNTGSDINVVRFGYESKYFNDRPDGTHVTVAYSLNDTNYTSISSFTSTTPKGVDGNASWQSTSKLAVIAGATFTWENGKALYIKWTGTNAFNLGFADPYGIDNISLQAFNASYVYDGTTWLPPGMPTGNLTDSLAIVLYGAGTAQITTSTSLKSIVLEPRAKLEVLQDLTVADTAVLQANGLGYSQVIGELLGPTLFQSYLNSPSGRWFNVAIPVDATWGDVTGVPVQTTGNPNSTNLWEYNAALQGAGTADGTWEPVASKAGAQTERIGYQLFAGDGTYFGSSPFTLQVVGDLLDGDQTMSVVGVAGGRYNFLPNPYPSTLDWDLAQADAANSEVGATIYMQDGTPDTTVKFTTYTAGSGTGPGKDIAPGQSFFVEVDNSGDGSVTFKNSHRNLSGNSQLYKTAAVAGVISLSTTHLGSGYNDETVLMFSPDQQDNYEVLKDGKKWMNTGYPNLYTFSDGEALVFNGLNNGFNNSTSVDLHFQGDYSGSYEINLLNDGLPAEWTVILEDKNTATFTNLRKSTYTYTHATGASADRFILHFNKTGAVGMEEMENSAVYSFVTGEILTVSLDNMKDARIRVYDISGKEMVDLTGQNDHANIDMSNWAKGVYVISVSANGKEVHQNKVVH